MSLMETMAGFGVEVSEENAPKITEWLNANYIESSKYEALATETDGLKSQLATSAEQLESLKKAAGDNDKLLKQIEELQTANADAKAKFEQDIFDLKKSHALEKALNEAKAINGKTVVPLLGDVLGEAELAEDGSIKGLAEALKALREDEATSFLFKPDEAPKIHGASPAGSVTETPGAADSYASRLAEARKEGNTLLAVSIKNEAAAEGIYLR